MNACKTTEAKYLGRDTKPNWEGKFPDRGGCPAMLEAFGVRFWTLAPVDKSDEERLNSALHAVSIAVNEIVRQNSHTVSERVWPGNIKGIPPWHNYESCACELNRNPLAECSCERQLESEAREHERKMRQEFYRGPDGQ